MEPWISAQPQNHERICVGHIGVLFLARSFAGVPAEMVEAGRRSSVAAGAADHQRTAERQQ